VVKTEFERDVKCFEEDAQWLCANYDTLREYEGKVVVIKNKQIILAAESIEEAVKELKKRGEDAAFLLITSIPPKDLSFIL